MLPETLSAHVCSLKQGEDRAALACHLQIAKDGQIKNWRFTRAKIRIAANIAYEDAQTAIDLVEHETQHGDLDEIIEISSSPCPFSEADMNKHERSEERRAGKTCVRTCRSRWFKHN